MKMIDRILEIAARELKLPREKLSSTSTPRDTPGWDSLATLRIVVAVEEEFGVTLTTQEFIEIQSIDTLGRVLDGKLLSGGRRV